MEFILNRRYMSRDALYAIGLSVAAHAKELAAIEADSVGKPLAQATGDIQAVIEVFKYFAGALKCLALWRKPILKYREGHADKVHGRVALQDPTRYHTMTLTEPLGVVGLIVSFNYPLRNFFAIPVLRLYESHATVELNQFSRLGNSRLH